MKKIITFDLDMTLLNHVDYRIPDSALMAVERLKEAGHIVAIATGRDMENYHGRPFLELLKPDAVIELNGTKVFTNEHVIYEHLFDKELLDSLIEFVLNRGYSMGITLGDDDYYFNQEKVEEQDLLRWGVSYRSFKDPWLIRDMPVRTLAYVGDAEGARDIEENFPQLKLPLFAGMSGADIIEKGSSKANGLRRLCEFYGIDIKETVSFGDSMNDYEILIEAGTGVAMGNSVEALKSAADFVTDDIDRDGIWNACIKLGLIREGGL